MMGRFRASLVVGHLLTLSVLVAISQACGTDEDCSLNGMCGRNSICNCDLGWIGADCGQLDLRAAKRPSGYNRTSEGTSSWGSTIIRDPWDHDLHHLFAAEFTHGCGLDYWAPYSRIIRAESRSGPAGPFTFAAEVQGTFAHNPTVIYSPADREWLMYYIGCPTEVSNTCETKHFTCGPGNTNNGESGVSVMASNDLRHWVFKGQVMQGDNTTAWDADVTNPSPLALSSSWSNGLESSGIQSRWGWIWSRSWAARSERGSKHVPAMLLVYRGCPNNCSGAEQINVAVSDAGYSGPYTKIQTEPIFTDGNEDPFVWRDKRGHYHILLHSLEPEGGFGGGPKVGRHAWARNYTGPWTFGNTTLAYTTEVEYNDGTLVNFYRRERPQLFFSSDDQMTPLLLTTGVQPNGNPMSYSVSQPIGDEGVKIQ